MHECPPEILIVADAQILGRTSAEIIVRQISASLDAKAFFTMVLAGGSTPQYLYTLLATDARFKAIIPWKRIHFFWGDERHVPPAHSDSNFKMADEAMLSKVHVPSENIHRIRGEDPDAVKIAAAYEDVLRGFFDLTPQQFPRFDCVLLGMGPDGHTASLFPETSALRNQGRLVVANWVEKFHSYRITMTAPVLNNAETIIFLVGGKDKAETLQKVLEGDPQPDLLPSQLIQPSHGQLLWIIERAASSRLSLGEQNVSELNVPS